MASTYTPQQAVAYAKPFTQNAFIEQVSVQMLDDINKIFWMYAPWRWTLGSMPPINLAPNTQEYDVTIPPDFLYLQNLWIYDGKTTRYVKPTAYVPLITSGVHQGQVQQVAVQLLQDATTGYRVSPVPGQFPTGAPVLQLLSLYKRTAPVITVANQGTPGTLIFPDEYFWVYEEGVLWKALSFAQDARAGDAKVQGSQIAYSGQLAKFMSALEQAKDLEKFNLEDKQQEEKT